MSFWEGYDLASRLTWQNTTTQGRVRFTCGYWGTDTTPSSGWHTDKPAGVTFEAFCLICTNCHRPSLIVRNGSETVEIVPQAMMGTTVNGLPSEINALYTEARKATGSGAYTPAVLTCRKILMHVAVEKGAPVGKNFLEYVSYLDTNNYIPKDAKGWVDHIRTKSNEANHEILIMTKQDADDLITFTEMLLRLTYEFQHRLPKPASPKP